MSIKTVLTVESVNSQSTRNMLNSIDKNRAFKEYEIHHCYCFRAGEFRIDENEIYSSINKCIKKYNPDLIVFHTGDRFKNNLNAFKNAILKLKAENGHILFSIQNRSSNDPEFRKILSVMDDNDEVINFENEYYKIPH